MHSFHDMMSQVFSKDKKKACLAKEEIAEILKTDVKILEAFEKAYHTEVLTDESAPENFFHLNAKQAAKIHPKEELSEEVTDLVNRIVKELIAQTIVYEYDRGKVHAWESYMLPGPVPVTKEEIERLPRAIQPQLAGHLMRKDTSGNAGDHLLMLYKLFQSECNPEKKQLAYHLFRQGMDILDLDSILYEMLGMNPVSMGYWLPALAKAVDNQKFFKIPRTTVIQVPMTLLQLTRIEYLSLTDTTKRIVDEYCREVFHLDESKEYFIKTGTYSSKYDFRNAYVHGAKEVRELGEYLLFIHFQALQMASPLNHPCIYGISTTREWVVREFIKDKEDNPCIYKGLPLHTEYRVFVDFDEGKVIGINPYWDPKVMKKRFGHEEDSDRPDQVHDYIIYQMHERVLMDRYNEHKDEISRHIEQMIPGIALSGQWSIDVMQNGDDFWIIDMAQAANSALRECVPAGILKMPEEDWLPRIPCLSNSDEKL